MYCIVDTAVSNIIQFYVLRGVKVNVMESRHGGKGLVSRYTFAEQDWLL